MYSYNGSINVVGETYGFHQGSIPKLDETSFCQTLQILKALHVLGHLVVLGISDKHDAIDAAQDQLARGVVDDLAWNGVKLKFGFETLDGHRFHLGVVIRRTEHRHHRLVIFRFII